MGRRPVAKGGWLVYDDSDSHGRVGGNRGKDAIVHRSVAYGYGPDVSP